MKIEEVLMSSAEIADKHHRAYLNIIYTGIWLEQQSSLPLRNYDLTHPQYNVMRIVSGFKKPIPVASIQERMLFKNSNVTRILHRLLEKGFVIRFHSEEDRRVVLIEMTESGKVVLNNLHDQIYNRVRDLIGKNLNIDETIYLGEVLDKMRE